MLITRRQFAQQAALATGSLAAAVKPCVAKANAPVPIVDTHQHLWDLTKFHLPWLDTVQVLKRSYVTKDFLQATRGLNVVKAVYMEVDVAPDQQTAEARHVIELCKSQDYPTVAAVISGRPGSPSFGKYITQFRDSPYIKGVRQVLQIPETAPAMCLEETFVKSVRLLGQLGMSFDLCMRPTELRDGAALARRCPDTRFIVDHCGNADPKAFGALAKTTQEKPQHDAHGWRRDIEGLAKLGNVVCKISGIVARAPKDNWSAEDLAPIVNHCLDQFGPDRVMFGGDWPVCTLVASYREWVQTLQAVVSERTREHQRKLFYHNAVRFYGLA